MSTLRIVQSYISGAALEAGLFVKLTAGKVVACGDGENPIGITLTSVDATDKNIDVVISGRCDVQAAEAIASGVECASDANGRAVAVAPSDYRCGLVVEAGIASSGGAFSRAVIVTQPIKAQASA